MKRAGTKPQPRFRTIVACRLKSWRLLKKAPLPVCGISSVECCRANYLRFKYLCSRRVATPTLARNAALVLQTLGGRMEFWRGDAGNVILRYRSSISM